MARKQEKKTKEVVVVYAEELQGVYINGELRYANRSIEWDEVLKDLGINFRTINCDPDCLAENDGELPDKLEDIKSK